MHLKGGGLNCKLAMRAYLLFTLSGRDANLESAVERFYYLINPAFDRFFPKLIVKLSSNDPVLISPRVKLLLKKRQTLIRKGMVTGADSQQILINDLTQQNQINAVRNKNNEHGKSTRRWWKTVYATISGRNSQAVPLNSLYCLEEVNRYFQGINTDPNYTAPGFIDVVHGTRLLASQIIISVTITFTTDPKVAHSYDR